MHHVALTYSADSAFSQVSSIFVAEPAAKRPCILEGSSPLTLNG